MDTTDIHRVEAKISDHIEDLLRKPCLSNDECAILQTWLNRLDYQLIDPVEPQEDSPNSFWAILILLLCFGFGRQIVPENNGKEAE